MSSGGRNDRAFIERECDGDKEGDQDRNSYKNFNRDQDRCIRRHRRPCGFCSSLLRTHRRHCRFCCIRCRCRCRRCL